MGRSQGCGQVSRPTPPLREDLPSARIARPKRAWACPALSSVQPDGRDARVRPDNPRAPSTSPRSCSQAWPSPSPASRINLIDLVRLRQACPRSCDKSRGRPSRVTAETRTRSRWRCACASRMARASGSSRSALFHTSMMRSARASPIPSSVEDTRHIGRLRLCFGMADIAHMQDQVGPDHLFQRGAESGDERCRKIGNEADRVGQDGLAPMWQGR